MGHDKELYQELIKLFDPNGVILFLTKTDMREPFLDSELEPLREFYYEWGDKPAKKFMNAQIELYREELWNKVDDFLDIIAEHTFDVEPEPLKRTVPKEWEANDPERFKKVVNDLESVGADIVRLYKDLETTAQKYF